MQPDVIQSIDFWQVHTVLFIICMSFFPRLTMFFATPFPCSFLSFFGWLLLPRLTVAIIATTTYWNTNKILIVFTWIWALSGEGGEKKTLIGRGVDIGGRRYRITKRR